MALHDRRIQGASEVHALGRRYHAAAAPLLATHAHAHGTSIRRRALRRSKGEFRLVFYPGSNLLVVIRKSTGKEERTYEAMGGFPDRRNMHDGHKVVHTPPGHYLLGKGQPHVTEAWWSSMIPWGAEISLDPQHAIVWTLRDGEGKILSHGEVSRNKKLIHKIYKWGQIPGNLKYPPGTKIPHWSLEEAYLELVRMLAEPNKDAAGKVTAKVRESERIWKRNDFGPRSYHLIQVTEPGHTGVDQGIYIHTTPDNERATEVEKKEKPELIYSHGCVHVRPVARQKMEDDGVLREGTYLEVKSYHARYKPLHDPEI